jgi:glucose-1-phosphate thymidylyltransferase
MMKGVILVGGMGTRLLPMTRVTNKHLLPVGRFPMVYYPLHILVEAGIRDIMIVTGGNAPGDFMELLHDGSEFGLEHLTFTYQRGAGGIADALRLARNFVGDDRVAVMLGDNILGGSIRAHVEAYREQPSGAKILLRKVHDPERFGVAEIDDEGRVLSIEEKPEKPKTDLAVVGVYMYDQRLWEIIPTLTPSGRGQLEITDVNNAYREAGELTADVLECEWSDAGTPESLFRAAEITRESEFWQQADLLTGIE